MANPVSSIIVSLDQVPDFLITQGGTVNQGSCAGIPVIAALKHFIVQANGLNVYSITFDLAEMKKAAAEAMRVNVSDVTVTYQNGELTLSASDGGGGNT